MVYETLTNFQPELSSVVMHLTRNLESGRFVVSRDAAVGHLSETNERALQWFSINLVTIFSANLFLVKLDMELIL
jgi:hypothetical protein